MKSESTSKEDESASMSGDEDCGEKLSKALRATQIAPITKTTSLQDKPVLGQQLADTTGAVKFHQHPMSLDEAKRGSIILTEVVEGGETSATSDGAAVPEVLQKKKRKNHRGGKKKKGNPQLETDTNDNGEMEGQGTTKLDGDGDALDAREDTPKHRLYEVRPSAGKGLGAFALRDIKRGTRIICEKPLMYLPGSNGLDVLYMFSELSEVDQAKFLSLHCHPGGINAEREKFFQLDSEIVPTDEQLKLMAIVNTNAFATEEGSVICLQSSRINHSCLPNVHYCWNDSIGAETIHAIRDISGGEEILASYIGSCWDRALREEKLDIYGFKCTCPCCDISTTFGKASEKRRKRLLEIDRDWGRLRNETQALAAVKESLDLFKQEGICNMKLTQLYGEAATFSASLGNLNEACEWAEKALENITSCAGKDCDKYEEEEKMLQDYVAKRDAQGPRKSR